MVRCGLWNVGIYCLAGLIFHRYLRAFQGSELMLRLTLNWWISRRLSLTMIRRVVQGGEVSSAHQNIIGCIENGGIKTDGHDKTVPILHERVIQITSRGDSHEI